jgi:hypothetical protein
MGNSEMDIIHVVRDLQTDGYTIRVPLVLDLLSDGVENNQRLAGNEEKLDQYYFDVQWKMYRHAVETTKFEREKSAVGMLEVKKPLLRAWAAEKIKYQLIDTFHSINGTKYSAASEAAKDAWLAANSDRVLFGNAIGNNAANDHSDALAQIDSTNDKLTAASVRLLKRVARNAWPRIRPFKTGTQGREYYVCFTHPRCFRDLNNDSAILAANRDARAREPAPAQLARGAHDGRQLARALPQGQAEELARAHALSSAAAHGGRGAIRVGGKLDILARYSFESKSKYAEGQLRLKGKVGKCPFCVKFGKTFKMAYDDGKLKKK